MIINSLKIVNFRNYERLNLEFNDSLNIFYGKNGVGKTNLVEAIYVLALTKSFRTNDKNLIKKDELSTKIEGVVTTNTENIYQVILNKEEKKVKIDNDNITKFSDYISNINVILLKPDEQRIFAGPPQDRRRLLNIEISQLHKEYINIINSYNKTIKQRNFYLRELYVNGNASREYLDILTKKLIEYGMKIYNYRKEFIDKINTTINKSYQSIFESGELKVKYISDFSNKDELEILNNYQKNYSREIILGKTLSGIHHDDFKFLLDNQNISEWGSNGQQKNAILAFKLAELEIFNEIKGSYPILILDDMFSALDMDKTKNIVKILNKDIQTFITTTDIEKIEEKLLKNAKVFLVTKGNIREV